jgi:hypothetical protein
MENSGQLPLNQQTNPPNPAQTGKQSASAIVPIPNPNGMTSFWLMEV